MRIEAAGLRVVRSDGRPQPARGEPRELRLINPVSAERTPAPGADESKASAVGTALLDAQGLEGLLLNLDASLHVSTRAQFFSWTQGLLSNLIRHRVLICALRRGRDAPFTVDTFSTVLTSTAELTGMLAREASLVSVLAEKWSERRFMPFVCATADFTETAGGPGLREVERTGAAELLVHGSHDVDGEVQGLSIFACQAGSVAARELYVAQLIIPMLHAAWVRTQTRQGIDGRAGSANTCILTERERGILRWVYLGKSNGEIGAILGISALTVKNHVQKILRKLNVVNRAQAVGRALDARIIRP